MSDRPITALRQHQGDEPEAELVVLDIDRQDVTIRLDDGEKLTFDRAELRSALDEAA